MNEQTSWDFTRIFKTKEDYDKCFSKVENSFKELSKFQGNLNNKENNIFHIFFYNRYYYTEQNK